MSKRLLLRCSKLGQEVYLDYCLSENSPLPCKSILKCWNVIFLKLGIDGKKWLKERLGEELWLKYVSYEGRKIEYLLNKIHEIRHK